MRRHALRVLAGLVVFGILGALYSCAGRVGTSKAPGPSPADRGEADAQRGAAAGAPDRTPPARAMRPAPGASSAEADVTAIAVDVNGRPLPGATALWAPADGPVLWTVSVMSPDLSRELATVRPDADGRFGLPDDVGRGTFRLFALASRDHVLLEHVGEVTADEVGGRRIAFVEASQDCNVTFRCVDELGAGVAGRSLVVERAWGNRFLFEAEAVTPEDGVVSVELHGAGEFRAGLAEPSFGAESTEVASVLPFRAAAGADVTLDWVVPRPGDVVVTVLDEGGRPLTGACVQWIRLDAPEDPFDPRVLSLGEQHHRIRRCFGAPGDALALHVVAAGRLPVSRTVRLTDRPIDATFRVAPGGQRVSGRLAGIPVTPGRHSAVRLEVLRLGTRSDDVYHLRLRRSEVTPADPAFEVRGVPPGEYRLAAPLPSSSGSVVPFHLRLTVGDADLDLGEIDLSPLSEEGPCELRVQVDADDAVGRHPAIVELRMASWPTALWRRMEAPPGTTVTVHRLVAGDWSVRVTSEGYDPDAWDLSAATEVSVRAGRPAPTVILPMRRR